jgi:hypothetical protein
MHLYQDLVELVPMLISDIRAVLNGRAERRR